MKWIIKKQTVSTEYSPLKKLNIMEGDNIVARLIDKDENSKDNANLIASAPEMFELLSKLRHVLEGQLLSTEIKQIDAIIAKVEDK